MNDAFQILYLVLQIPLFGVAIGGLVLAALHRRRKPLACGLFAAGVVLLIGSHALSLAVWQFDLYEWVTDQGVDFETFNLGMVVVNSVTATLAAGLITAAVFVREDGTAAPRA